VALVAQRAVDGVIDATKEVGGNVTEAAKATVGGAIEAAGSIGNTAVKAAKDILVGVVEGVKDIGSAALPKPRPSFTKGELAEAAIRKTSHRKSKQMLLFSWLQPETG